MTAAFNKLPKFWRILLLCLGVFLAGFLVSNFAVMPLVARYGEEVEVPDLRGQNFSQARETAAARGFEVSAVGWKYDASLPDSSVATQQPEARKMLRRGRTIRLVLSRGLEKIEIPYLVGLSAVQAINLLSRMGLTVSRMDSLASDSVALGCVICSKPASGSKLARGGAVKLTLSRGPTEGKMLMPELIGRKLVEVQSQLVGQGIVIGEVKYISGQAAEPGTIILQAPQPGFVIKRGDTVNVAVSTQ
jgi:eukaryotic-like serine/threonine-protein kinase